MYHISIQKTKQPILVLFLSQNKIIFNFFSGNISRRPIITWTSPTGYYPRPHFRIGKMPPDPTGPDPRGSAGPYPLSISGKPAVLVIISNYCPNKLGRNILFDNFEISKVNFSKKDIIFLILTFIPTSQGYQGDSLSCDKA